MSDVTQKGGCLCEAVGYEFSQSNVISAHHCHCKDCQKSTGSGRATILLIPADALEVNGEIKYYSVTGSEDPIYQEVFVKIADLQ